MKIDRRYFLSLGIGAAAGTALSPLPWKSMDDSSIWSQNWPWTPVPPDGEATYENSTCTLCPGGCGITVCPEWDSLDRFITDMGPRPTPSHELDRIDNTKGYSKSNCRWTTHGENMRNTRRNVIDMGVAEAMRCAYINGMTRKEIAAKYGVGYHIVRHVIAGDRWAKESA